MTDSYILLVEDNPDDVDLTLRAFKKGNIASRIEVARDGVEALELLFDRSADIGLPQVVLLDLNLPRVSGLQVLEKLREEERTRLLPVVILTSSREQRDRLQGYSLGANSYVCKPVDTHQFTDAMRQLGLYWLVLNEHPPVERS